MRHLKTHQFPQADRLDQVALVAQAVGHGGTTDSAIEEYLGLNSKSRQGRYYRKAAEILGLIRTHANHSRLTPNGRVLIGLRYKTQQTDFLAKCLTDAPVFKQVTRFIEERKPTPAQLAAFVIGIYPGSSNTARRRASTISAFILEARLARMRRGRLVPGLLAGASLVDDERDESGLFGTPVSIDAKTKERLTKKSSYHMEVDSAKIERANLIHHKLVTAKARFLRGRSFPAKRNQAIDLFSRSGRQTVIYEMKSISNDNFVPQVRRAISQLYEYRFVFGVVGASLCVVANKLPDTDSRWYLKYLQRDRGIAYVWTEDFSDFSCESDSSKILGAFAP